MTDIHAQAKPDTVLLLDAVAADPYIDFSQYRTDLADNTTYLDESPSARTAIDTDREISLVWDVTSGETGVLVEHGNGVTYGYQVSVTAGNVIECRENGTLRVSLTMSGLTTSDRKVLIVWSKHRYDTEARSVLLFYNFTSTSFTIAQATHPTDTTSATDTLTIGAGYGGATPFAGGLDFYYVRIGRRFHSTTESREDWVTQSTQPSTTQTRRGAVLVPDRSTMTASLAADGDFVGPAHLWAGHVFEQSDRRLAAPLVNVRPFVSMTIDYGHDMPITAWWSTPPGDSTLHACVSYLFRRPVPPKCNRGHVRAFVKLRDSGGTSPAAVTMRAYSIAGLPVVGQPGEPLVYRRTAATTHSTDDGSTTGAGTWLSLGALDLVPDAEGMTWILVALKFDADDPDVADTTVRIFAVTIDPYHDPADDGAFGFEDP